MQSAREPDSCDFNHMVSYIFKKNMIQRKRLDSKRKQSPGVNPGKIISRFH